MLIHNNYIVNEVNEACNTESLPLSIHPPQTSAVCVI